MGILCKLFGHKPNTIGGKENPHLVLTGWELDYNTAYKWVEFGHRCDRCSKLYPVGIYPQPKEIPDGHQN